jgi:glycosyltransferase involved in cell wall biosynthesis
MKKLKICLVSLTVSPDTADGEATVIRALFDYLKNEGHIVKLISGKWNVNLENPDIIQITMTRKRFLWIFQFNYKVIKYLRNNDFDIIHSNSAKAALPIILSFKKKFICTIHDFTPFETNLTLLPFEKLLTRFVSKKATYLITVSNFIKDKFNVFLPKIEQNKIITIYNAISSKFKPYPEKAEILKKELGLIGPVILSLGRIAQYKGVEQIITAYNIIKKENPTLKLVIGGTPDFLMNETYEKWKRIYGDVIFTGYIEEENLPIYYTLADIFINYSSSSEGFGLTPLEAIACGTPVICSDLKVFREIFQDNVIYVPPNNPEALAEKIRSIITNKARGLDLVNKAQVLLTKYSWVNSGKKLEQLYTKFLSKNVNL